MPEPHLLVLRVQLENMRKETAMTMHRKRLLAAITWYGEHFPAMDWDNHDALIRAWWKDYKEAEAQETFESVFKANRMAIKELKHEVEFIAKEDFSAAPRYKRAANEPTPPLEKFPQHWYDTGVSGMKHRVDPSMFTTPTGGGKSKKYEYGLHDISMSLLDKRKTIMSQTFTKLEERRQDGRHVIFMPLAPQEDLNLFFRLNDIAKATRGKYPLFYAWIRKIREQMTRVKQAWEYDMGSNFIALSPKDQVNPKLKYGMVNKYKLPGQEKDQHATPEHRQLAKDNSRDYTSILDRMNNARYNEIVVAMRVHANPAFPLFTNWRHQQKVFEPYDAYGTGATLHAPIPGDRLLV
jgi:hypothetical protein